ncbi:MAG: DNA-binding MarR family transcriptional regulator [Planctomycetota bacterium]|jgi:DNA-binding MarR family transcriptional regulator
MNDLTLSSRDVRKLAKIIEFLGFARTEIDHDITAQRVVILINVCLHEGLSQNELLQKLEHTSVTALSRNLADLSNMTSRKMQGPGLLELRNDPLNLRKKRVYLTKAGKMFLSRWLNTLE